MPYKIEKGDLCERMDLATRTYPHVTPIKGRGCLILNYTFWLSSQRKATAWTRTTVNHKRSFWSTQHIMYFDIHFLMLLVLLLSNVSVFPITTVPAPGSERNVPSAWTEIGRARLCRLRSYNLQLLLHCALQHLRKYRLRCKYLDAILWVISGSYMKVFSPMKNVIMIRI